MKNKKIIAYLLILVTLCIGISSVGATPYNSSNKATPYNSSKSSNKTCSSYKKKKNCNNNSSCTWVSKKCRVKTCTSLSSNNCSGNTDKNKKKCQWNGSTCCPNGRCNNTGMTSTLDTSGSNLKNLETNTKSSNSTSGNIKGCDVLGPKTSELLKWGLNLLRIGGPLLVIALGITDFLKVLLSGEDKEYKECGKKFIKRLLALVVLQLLPYILFFVIDISGVTTQYGIERGEIYCVLDF